MSPYLFVMAIEVFSKLLNKTVVDRRIVYHPYCSKTRLNHLGFADDLMIFLMGDSNSLNTILSIFDEFYIMSALCLNPEKTKIYCVGMEQEQIQIMLYMSGFKRGSLPVRYLGVPLFPSRLRDKEWKPLIDNITGRIESWMTKKLSYVGRLQLVQSVIYSLLNFWCSAFILPKKVITVVEKRCKSFLSKSKANDARGAKIKWGIVCLPKAEGDWD